MKGDRLFGLVALMTALAYIASATQIQNSFLSDPVGPKAFPILIGCVALVAALFMIIRPEPNPEWPHLRTFGALILTLIVLLAYAVLLIPLGFLISTALTTAILSFQINQNIEKAVVTGGGLAVGLFAIFKYALGLGLVAFPSSVFG